MQTRKNSLPVILAVIVVIVVVAIIGVTLVSAGIFAALIPVRSESTPVIVIEETAPVEPDLFPFSDLPGMPVHDVRVEIGVGSPIPVEVVASGEWSTLCAQLVETNLRYVTGRQIHIELLSDPGPSDCPADMLGLPFSIRIPINIVEFESGEYSVIVNGVQTDFEWNGPLTEAQGHFPELIDSVPTGLLPIPVLNAQVEIGVGSPIPVEVAVAGEWPNLCSQLAQVKTSISGQQINIELLATPADTTCPPDNIGLPFGFHIPLNMVEMQPGTYTVTVNGTQTSFEWPPASEPEGNTPAPLRVTFIGPDGNVWLVDLPENTPRMVTNDATSMDPAPSNISYNEPRLSSDGKYVAYRRGAGIAQVEGMSIDFGLWVADLTTGESQEVYDMSPSGYNWLPGSHLLAYIPELEGQYFTNRGDEPDSTYAKGILGYDADSGETRELVKPERGYALYNPVWSPDGRFLSFDELLYYEGRGPFAYYDFDAGRYIAWEQPLGMYSWSPNGEELAYDNLTYTATGEERIYIRTRQSRAVSQFSLDYNPGYAIMPTFSPLGDLIAYLVNLEGAENQSFTLFVQPFPQGEPVALGEFENVYLLNWSPDGTRLFFSSGSYGEQWITEVNLLTGESRDFSKGMQPSVSVIP